MEININGNVTINNFSVNENASTNEDASVIERLESSQVDEENISPEEVTAPTKFAERLLDENATLNDLLLALAANPDAQNAAANEFADKEDEEKKKALRDKFGEDFDLVFENKPELQKQKRRPGAIQLRLNCICIALAEGAGSGVCEVYSNGYAVYDNGNRRTVIWVPDCSSTTYFFGKLRDKEKEYLKEKEVIGADILGDCPWCTALIIAGENTFDGWDTLKVKWVWGEESRVPYRVDRVSDYPDQTITEVDGEHLIGPFRVNEHQLNEVIKAIEPIQQIILDTQIIPDNNQRFSCPPIVVRGE